MMTASSSVRFVRLITPRHGEGAISVIVDTKEYPTAHSSEPRACTWSHVCPSDLTQGLPERYHISRCKGTTSFGPCFSRRSISHRWAPPENMFSILRFLTTKKAHESLCSVAIKLPLLCPNTQRSSRRSLRVETLQGRHPQAIASSLPMWSWEMSRGLFSEVTSKRKATSSEAKRRIAKTTPTRVVGRTKASYRTSVDTLRARLNIHQANNGIRRAKQHPS